MATLSTPLRFHWPEQVTWPSPGPRQWVKDVYSVHAGQDRRNTVDHKDRLDDLIHTRETGAFPRDWTLQECVVISKFTANPDSTVPPCSLLPFS